MCQHVYYRSVEALSERPSGHVPVCVSLNQKYSRKNRSRSIRSIIEKNEGTY